ncbi:MAG: Mut7-C RNAse domain-containing protein [Aquificaceae bacterium]
MRRFLLESGLDKLAHWLRLLGVDALILQGEVKKGKVLQYPDRVFITTSRKLERHLKAWGVNYLVLPKEDWKVQLCLLLKYFNIKGELRLNRCYYCNTELITVDREKVKERIPPMVYIYGEDFTLCPNCGKVYWKGSHHPRLGEILKRVLSSC